MSALGLICCFGTVIGGLVVLSMVSRLFGKGRVRHYSQGGYSHGGYNKPIFGGGGYKPSSSWGGHSKPSYGGGGYKPKASYGGYGGGKKYGGGGKKYGGGAKSKW